jgi:competence protein ComEA
MNGEPISARGARLLAAAMLALAGAIVFATITLLTDEPRSATVEILPPLPTRTAAPTASPAPLQIYVIGAVATDEALISLPPDSRIGDAITAAGGALPEADLRRINLAEPLRDGQMVVVPFVVQDGTPGDAALTLPTTMPATGDTAATLININTASLEALQRIPGIGPALAQRIIEYRTANGPFTMVDDLINVAGIGETTLENIRPFITAN